MIQMQMWSSSQLRTRASSRSPPLQTPGAALLGYCSWWAGAIFCWWACWVGGMNFTLRLSLSANHSTMSRILRAPVDKFFDRTPVGRIMNRLSTDLVNIDIQCYNQISLMLAIMVQNLVPIIYVHVVMPIYFTLFTAPLYVMMAMVLKRYWKTFVPLRYLSAVSKSATDTTLTDVEHGNSFVRAMQKGKFRFAEFQEVIGNQIKADVCTALFCKRWAIMRIYCILAFYTSTMVLVMIWVPNIVSFGMVGLCLSNLLRIAVGIEMDVEVLTGVQFQLISMNRIHEYTMLPQERDAELPSDKKYKNFSVKVWRSRLGALEIVKDVCGDVERPMKLAKKGVDPQTKEPCSIVMLEEYIDENGDSFAAFVPPKGKLFTDLAPSEPELAKITSMHRLVGVDAGRGDADLLAQRMCSGTLPLVRMHFESGWLCGGAHIVIEDLVAGYGDIPRNILNGISLEIQPRSKCGVVGTTGCGKSTLLLTLLRILEPRSGRILLNGVDTQNIGLDTLRGACGLVPQDPVLFQTSIRDNMDPWKQYDDDAIWDGLRMVQLAQTVEELDGGLAYHLQAGSSNLSFGQRQLLCLARVIIKQSRIIILDEATSALDPRTQELVQNTIETRFPGSTLVVIAHRLETILDFDTIVVMKDGRIL